MATFLGKEFYDTGIVKFAAALKPCPFAGVITPDQIKIALGEYLDIWPASIANEALANAISEL